MTFAYGGKKRRKEYSAQPRYKMVFNMKINLLLQIIYIAITGAYLLKVINGQMLTNNDIFTVIVVAVAYLKLNFKDE
jgi:hypothetical protein